MMKLRIILQMFGIMFFLFVGELSAGFVSPARIYWTDFTLGRIQRANIDGTGIEDVVTGLGGPVGIAIDPFGRQIYWTDPVADKIQRANLDGSGVEDLITSDLGVPVGLALDVTNGKMYWAGASGNRTISRANLDGTQIEVLISSGLNTPLRLALDVAGEQDVLDGYRRPPDSAV